MTFLFDYSVFIHICMKQTSHAFLLSHHSLIPNTLFTFVIHLNLNRHNNIFKDVYREVGILEVFVECLIKYNGFLQKHIDVDSDPYDVQLTNQEEIENGNFTIFIRLIFKDFYIFSIISQ